VSGALCDAQVKLGFACEEDVKTIKSQITGRIQQLKREREGRRLSLVSAVDSQQPSVTTAAGQLPSVTSNPAASVNRQSSQEKDGHADGELHLKRFVHCPNLSGVQLEIVGFGFVTLGAFHCA